MTSSISPAQSSCITMRTAAITALVASVLLVALPAISLAAQAGHLPTSCNIFPSSGFCWGMNALAISLFATGIVLAVKSFAKKGGMESSSTSSFSEVMPQPKVDPTQKRALVRAQGEIPPIDSQGGIETLPGELIIEVMKWVPPHDRAAAAATCKAFQSAVSDYAIWNKSDYHPYLLAETPTIRNFPEGTSIGPMAFWRGSIIMAHGTSITQYGRGFAKIKELPAIQGMGAISHIEVLNGNLVVRGKKRGRSQGTLIVVMSPYGKWSRITLAAAGGQFTLSKGVLYETQKNSLHVSTYPLEAEVVTLKASLGEFHEASIDRVLQKKGDRYALDEVELQGFTSREQVRDFHVFGKTLALCMPTDGAVHIFKASTGKKIEMDLPKLTPEEFAELIVLKDATLVYPTGRRVEIYPIGGKKESHLLDQKIVKLTYAEGVITAQLQKAKPSTIDLPFEGKQPFFAGEYAIFSQGNQLFAASIFSPEKSIELAGDPTVEVGEEGDTEIVVQAPVSVRCFGNTLAVRYEEGAVRLFDAKTGQPLLSQMQLKLEPAKFTQIQIVADRMLLSSDKEQLQIFDLRETMPRQHIFSSSIQHFSYIAGKVVCQLEGGIYQCLDFVSPSPVEIGGGYTFSRALGESRIMTPDLETIELQGLGTGELKFHMDLEHDMIVVEYKEAFGFIDLRIKRQLCPNMFFPGNYVILGNCDVLIAYRDITRFTWNQGDDPKTPTSTILAQDFDGVVVDEIVYEGGEITIKIEGREDMTIALDAE